MIKIELNPHGSVLLGLAMTAVFAGGAAAQDAPAKTIRAVRVDTPPVIDGLLDDPVWAQAEPISDFVQVRPTDGGPPSETTEVYLLYDDDTLYVGARLGDSDPDQIAANTMRHNVGLGRTDDRLVLILDPFNTRRGGYRFETNANGVRHDMLYQNVSQVQTDWNAIWDTAGSVDENGWLAEMAIPFKSLAFDPAADAWGFNFARSIQRRGEEIAWVSRNRSYNPSIAGLATGFEGLSQGVGLDIVPSLALVEQKFYDPGGNNSETNPSLNIYYRLTPSLNGSLTFNTDFSAVEVDNRQVNLTRFSLFFPERRDFFLNDADLFEFARIGGQGFGATFNRAQSRSDRENSRPFFSRRIGLAANGAPVDLKYGGKISGRVGRWNIGTLAIRQDGYQ
ncbi:MAG: carbohydrate binding family 9 domain-containing protein, partial [Gammaproteobacteria bacterium]|nr:carbohydrate binding family 9 domain-containing protein [Gammaproteobacteria bacterium]